MGRLKCDHLKQVIILANNYIKLLSLYYVLILASFIFIN